MTTTPEWPQYSIECTDLTASEQVAVERLNPELAALVADGAITSWWFIRKFPGLRLRYLPADDRARRHLETLLDDLTAGGSITGWTPGIYEPEVHAFGGPAGMDVAHELFQQDSRSILDHLARRRAAATGEPGPRELGILLFSVLMRGAGLDWYEQGDVWARVAANRPAADTTAGSDRLKNAVHRLMTTDAGPRSSLVAGGRLAALTDWIRAFDHAGRQLADLNRRGLLERGLRAVIAHHVIFQWNRLGLSAADQGVLSNLAKEIVMGPRDSTGPATKTGIA
ncbi:thiopeptide-type bacteriocin biosynthesis protein [Streptomyces fagopyri]|uniref:thiopeptide-type bacteriocin biosynthesis protein n=1 Tax=Streptomyces fagopyri TaxID=2662397 RepID=UPI00372052C1